MTDITQITQVLRDELALQTRHCALLEAQQCALRACDRATFCALHEEHEILIEQLDAQQARRQAILRDDRGFPVTLSALLEIAPERNKKALSSLRDQLQRTLTRTQALTRENAPLIENELKYFAFTLDLFVEAGRRNESAYGGSGMPRGRLLLDRRA